MPIFKKLEQLYEFQNKADFRKENDQGKVHTLHNGKVVNSPRRPNERPSKYMRHN